MRSLIIRIVISAIVIGVVTSGILRGVRIEGNFPTTWIALTLIFTLVNMFIKPILQFLTCPFIILSLGLIGFVINIGVLYLTQFLGNQLITITAGRLVIENILYGALASLIITVTTIILEQIFQTTAPRIREKVTVQKVTEVRYVVQQQRADFDAQFDQRLAQNAPPGAGYTDVSAPPPYGYQQPPAQQTPQSYGQPPQAPPPGQNPPPFGSRSQQRPPQTGTPDDWDFDDPAFPKR